MEPNEIVQRVLQSSELRNSLENTVRNLSGSGELRQEQTGQGDRRNASVTHELHRLFPSIRGNHARNVLRETPHRMRRNRTNPKIFFYKEINIVKSPTAVTTLTGLGKSQAFENGLALSNAQFSCNWSRSEIYDYIRQLFKSHLDEIPFELMVPMNRHLIKINLPHGEELNGKSLKAIFQQKVIYVRPSQHIISLDDNGNEECPTTSEDNNLTLNTTSEDNNLTLNEESDTFDRFENDTQLAISESLCTNTQISYLLIKDLLEDLKIKIHDNIFSQFNIYREDIFNCCVRAMNRKTFSAFNTISVKFSDIEGNSEGAVDAGGPKREMFRLILNYIKNSKLFFGEEKKYISLNRDSLKNQEYFEAGRLIALSLIHGGPGPHFFSEKLYSVLVYGFPETIFSVDEVEPEIKEKIIKLKEIDDLGLITQYIDQEPTFSIAGCHLIHNIEDKDKLFFDMIQFYAYHRVRPALDQLKDGLGTGGIYELMRCNATIFKDIMCANSMLITATLLENLFKVDYSEIGSSKRVLENRVITFWRDLLLDTEENGGEITLKDILIFATGADTIPPLGFDLVPKITFLHDESLYPMANTCSLDTYVYQLFTKHTTILHIMLLLV